jgi:ABC-2 type transport system permease protein
MTTTLEGISRQASTSARHVRLTFSGVLNSEWIKLRTLRSTFWCYVIVVALTVLLGLLIAGTIQAPDAELSHDAQQSTWMSAATLGINFSQLVIGVLGALLITGEYGTGMIRSTFAAVPRRLPAMFAKAIVFGVVTFVVALVGLVAAALVTAPLLAGKGVTADFGDPDVWLTLLGGAAYLTFIGLIAFAIGLLIRSSAGGIAAALGLVLVVPVIFNLLVAIAQAQWAANVATFLPSNAGGKLYAYPADVVATTTAGSRPGLAAPTTISDVDLSNWQGLLVLVAWFAVIFVVGLVVLKRRDA